MSALIVLVNTHAKALRQTEAILSESGHLVATAATYASGRELLRAVTPDLLITDVQLGAFNGLHLVVVAGKEHPGLPVIVTHPTYDSVIDHEARRLGATFVAAPLTNVDAFGGAVESLVATHTGATQIRRWPRKRASVTMSAQVEATTARILDLSYGGVRLALGDPTSVPYEFNVTVPDVGITVRAQRVWTGPSPAGREYWCGAVVLPFQGEPETAWREFVDSVS